MRKLENETYQQWSDRARIYEYGIALQRIAKGEDVDTILETMSKNLTLKLMHPYVKALQDSVKTDYDPLQSQANYKRNYLDKTKPIADHMNDVENA